MKPLAVVRKHVSVQETAYHQVELHFTLLTEKENSVLYKELLENQQIEAEMQSELHARGIQLTSLKVG